MAGTILGTGGIAENKPDSKILTLILVAECLEYLEYLAISSVAKNQAKEKMAYLYFWKNISVFLEE